MEKGSEAAEVIPGVLEQFLDSAYSYNFWQNPDRVRSVEDARRNGINCVSLAHLALKALFDYKLPPELGCAELYRDREHFRLVKGIDEGVDGAQRGDLVWFGVQEATEPPEAIELVYDDQGQLINWGQSPVKHVAVHTGVEEFGEPLLLHSTFMYGGGNAIWPLSEFSLHPRYSRLYGVTRLVAALDEGVDQRLLVREHADL